MTRRHTLKFFFFNYLIFYHESNITISIKSLEVLDLDFVKQIESKAT